MTKLPPRFTESAFRRYEDTIALAVTWQPTPYVFQASDYAQAPITTVCRLRDAIRSLHDNRWSSRVDASKFVQVFPLSVAQSKDGTRIAVYKEGTDPWATPAQAPLKQDVLSLPDGVDLPNTLAFLAQEQALCRPLSLGPALAQQVQTIAPNYDIHLEPTGNGGAILY